MKKLSNFALCTMLLGSAAVFISCDDEETTPPITEVPELTLYEKLGGTTMVSDPNNPNMMIEQGRLSYRSVVDSTINLIVADIVMDSNGNLGEHFAPVVGEVLGGDASNVAVLSKNLTDFFSANTGGGATNTYSGMGMVAAHDPAQNPRMGVKANDADYTKFIGYVGQSAGLNGVTDTELINEVVAVLESLRDPIVQE